LAWRYFANRRLTIGGRAMPLSSDFSHFRHNAGATALKAARGLLSGGGVAT